MLLPVPRDLDFGWALGFLGARAVPCLEATTTAEYRRSLRLGDRPITMSVRRVRGGLAVRSAPSLDRATLLALVTRMFDLDADLGAFRAMAAKDRRLRPLVASCPGLRLPVYVDPFEGLVRAVLGQQVSLAAARTMADRLVRLAGRRAPPLDGARFLAFPQAPDLLAAGPTALRRLGLTRAKAAALSGLSAAVVEGRLDWNRIRDAPGEEAQTTLEALPGIGPWTASYVRMRVLGDRDAFPAADLGLRKALGSRSRRPTGRQVEARAEAWRPWRAYATLHLWRSLSGAP